MLNATTVGGSPSRRSVRGSTRPHSITSLGRCPSAWQRSAYVVPWVRVPPMTPPAAHARITLRTVDPLGEKVRDPQCYGMALVTNHVRRSDFTSPTARRGAAAAVDGAARLPFAPSATDNDCASPTPSPSRLARSHHRPPRSFIGARSATTHLTRGNGSERPRRHDARLTHPQEGWCLGGKVTSARHCPHGGHGSTPEAPRLRVERQQPGGRRHAALSGLGGNALRHVCLWTPARADRDTSSICPGRPHVGVAVGGWNRTIWRGERRASTADRPTAQLF